jgi:beta-lactamase regulating signal transducer with metallopeptidase domain
VFLVRLLVALASLWLLHRRARAVWVPELSLPGSKRRFRICESDAVGAPTAIGLWSPKILLPPGFASALASDELRQVVRHEAAHLDRRDDWTNLVQHLILALMPINPFIWCVIRRLRLEREMACDDRVLAELPATKQYARLLTRLAVCRTTSLTLASGVGQTGRQLYPRIARILDRRCNRESRMSPGALTCVSFGLVGSGFVAVAWLPVVAIAPRPATERLVNAEAAPIHDCSPWTRVPTR